MMAPLFSILTPAYNAEATLQRTIDSVRAQTCSDWEHIIVDDGSADATVDIARAAAESDARIRVIAAPHRGVSLTRIAAMEAAQGRYLARLDADDEMLPEYLEKVGEVFADNPDVQIVSTNGYQVFPNGNRRFYYADPIFSAPNRLTISDLLDGKIFGTSAVMSREVWERTGGPRPEARSEDIDLWMRALAMGFVHQHLPEPLFLYNQGAPGQLTGDVRAVWASHVEIVESLIRNRMLSDDDVKRGRKMNRKNRLRLCLHWDKWGRLLSPVLADKLDSRES